MKDEIRELDALLEYLINHNKDHVNVIIALAEKVRGLRKKSVYADLMLGVGAMNASNQSLTKALKALRGG